MATLAIVLVAVPGHAQSTGIHVFLSGEDESELAALPPARDPPFDPVTWTGPEVLGELIRAPVSATPPAADIAAAPRGTPVTQSAQEPGVAAAAPRAAAASIATAPGAQTPPADAGDGALAVAGAAPDAGAPAVGAPGAVTAALPPGLPPSGDSGAEIDVWYRTGHRLGLGGWMSVDTPTVAAAVELRAIAADDLVPSPLSSPSSLAARAGLSLSAPAPPLGLDLEASALAQPDPGGVTRGRLRAALTGRFGTGSFAATAGAVVEGSGAGWALLPQAGARLALAGPLAVELRASGVLGTLGPPLGRLELTLDLDPWRTVMSARAGVSAALEAGRVTVLPVLGLDWRPAGLALALEAGPRLGYAAGLPWWETEMRPAAGAERPERVFVIGVRGAADLGAASWIELTGSVGFGELTWVGDAGYDVAPGGWLALGVRAEIPAGSAAMVALALTPLVAWSGGDPALRGAQAAVSLEAGFWRVSLTGILTTGPPGWPAGLTPGPRQALDVAAGPQVAVKVERRASAPRGWAEVRVGGDPLPWAAFELGFSLGER